MKSPFSFWEKREYKKAFIEEFGAEYWKTVHEGYPYAYIDNSGKHQVKNIVPEMPMDVANWLIYEKQWPLAIWQKCVIGETMDLGSNIQHNSAEAAATAKNVAQDVGAATQKTLFLLTAAALAAAAVVYRAPIQRAVRSVQKAIK